MQVTGTGIQISDGGLIVLPYVAPSGLVSGDPNLSLGNTFVYTANTYMYIAQGDRVAYASSAGSAQFTNDTNNMVWQVFYAHKAIRISANSAVWGPIPRQGGNNSLGLHGAIALTENSNVNYGNTGGVANSWNVLQTTGGSVTYSQNVLAACSVTNSFVVPAKRYFLLGFVGGPFYRNFRKTANTYTATIDGNAVVTVIPEVYHGNWPTGFTQGIPTGLLNGNTSNFTRMASNIYVAGVKFNLA